MSMKDLLSLIIVIIVLACIVEACKGFFKKFKESAGESPIKIPLIILEIVLLLSLGNTSDLTGGELVFVLICLLTFWIYCTSLSRKFGRGLTVKLVLFNLCVGLGAIFIFLALTELFNKSKGDTSSNE